MTKTYDALNRALLRAGIPKAAIKHLKGTHIKLEQPINIITNMGLDAEPYKDILLEFAPKLTDPNEIESVARCMIQNNGFSDAVPWLLSLFHGFPKNGLNDSNLWAIGDAIYRINNKKHYPDVITICHRKKYGSGRQNLMGTLARARTDDAYQVLVECLDDPSVRAHAIEALGRSGRTEAIPILERTVGKKGLYEFKARQTALRRLNRKLAKEK